MTVFEARRITETRFDTFDKATVVVVNTELRAGVTVEYIRSEAERGEDPILNQFSLPPHL